VQKYNSFLILQEKIKIFFYFFFSSLNLKKINRFADGKGKTFFNPKQNILIVFFNLFLSVFIERLP